MERLYRDNRLNHIHEGTWGIQGLDILGRKVQMHNGAAVAILREEIQGTIDSAAGHPSLQEHTVALEAALTQMEATVQTVATCSEMEGVLPAKDTHSSEVRIPW